MSWRKDRLGGVLTLKRGYDLPESKRTDGRVPVVSSAGITGFHAEAKVAGPGVVTGRYGTLGEVYYLDQSYWPLNTALYVQDFKGNDERFTAYFLKYVLRGRQSDKSAVPGVNRNDLHEVLVSVPDVDVQRRIAARLGRYDDLIAVNERRIAALEEACRLVHDEWFERGRYPGSEHSALSSNLPKGWALKPLDSICPEVKEAVSPANVDPHTPYIGLEHMPRRSITLREWGLATEVSSSKSKYREGDILFGKIRPYFHKVGLALTDGIASSDAIVLRPIEAVFRSFLVLTISSDRFVAVVSKTAKEGAKMPRANWDLMKKSELRVPPPTVLDSLDVLVRPITTQLRSLALANRNLRMIRDLLLPLLMTGEIDA